MSRARPFRTLLWLALAVAPGLASCSSASDSSAHPEPIALGDVVLEGEASASQLRVFLEHRAREWAWAGGRFDAPDDGATVSAGVPLRFTWQADPADFAAGGAPGDVVMTHLLAFSTPSNSSVLQVFSTRPEYTPDAESWQKLVDAGGPITVSLTTGSFVGSDLPEEGGPFIGQTLTFTIE